MAKRKDAKLYSLPEVVKLRGIGESTLRHAAIAGELKAVKVGQRAWAVTLEAVDEWLKNRRKPGRPKQSS
jgi:excisionase family DNA binding protein